MGQTHGVLDRGRGTFPLEEGGIVHFHAVITRRSEFRVEVQRPHSETRVLASNEGEHLLRGVGVIILVVVEIGQDNVLLQAIGDRLQFRWRREASADGGVEMRVVAEERQDSEQRTNPFCAYSAWS